MEGGEGRPASNDSHYTSKGSEKPWTSRGSKTGEEEKGTKGRDIGNRPWEVRGGGRQVDGLEGKGGVGESETLNPGTGVCLTTP